jgi:hypothetical protein
VRYFERGERIEKRVDVRFPRHEILAAEVEDRLQRIADDSATHQLCQRTHDIVLLSRAVLVFVDVDSGVRVPHKRSGYRRLQDADSGGVHLWPVFGGRLGRGKPREFRVTRGDPETPARNRIDRSSCAANAVFVAAV